MQLPRMSKTTALALLLVACVALIAPQQLGIIVYKVALVTLAGVAGYILDRALFPYARPDKWLPNKGTPTDCLGCELNSRLSFTAQYRRAVIVAAAMLAIGLGL